MREITLSDTNLFANCEAKMLALFVNVKYCAALVIRYYYMTARFPQFWFAEWWETKSDIQRFSPSKCCSLMQIKVLLTSFDVTKYVSVAWRRRICVTQTHRQTYIGIVTHIHRPFIYNEMKIEGLELLIVHSMYGRNTC